MPFHLNNLAHTSFEAKSCDRALSILDGVAKFCETEMPIELQGYVQALHIMGLVYRAPHDDKKSIDLFSRSIKPTIFIA
ncbi:unnamed protein product [Rotaria sp. Silwood2]|nr:unnamed protein product [Rotaria sp. Silwood2]CAF3243422.1 unnamed protein product [Rotaria sp. Silwood2]CAF3372916.1 unnamed protein product [Rotaria sp. Silwood2]CAF4391084.1 unnamed protein product [Rotaria sp. Silwood2]CAF4496960.1 unnamed protein product [Rotaria sp. Silwood2]